MAPSGMRTATIQACVLNVASTVLAQLLKFWKTGLQPAPATWYNPLGLDFLPIFQFLLWCLIATPPNYKWQEFLEQEFPGKKPFGPEDKIKGHDEKGRLGSIEAFEHDTNYEQGSGEGRLDLGNTAKKFLLDQTIGALVNNAGFLFGITLIRGGGLAEAIAVTSAELWPIMWAAYKFWPLFSIVQFTIVPPERRIVMGSIAGLFWGIFMVLRVT